MNRSRIVWTIAVSVLVCLVAVAWAGKYDQKTLHGTWEFDMVKMLKMAAEAGEMPPGMDIETMASNMYMHLTFNKDGTYTFESKTMGNPITETGTWEVVSSDGDKMTMKTVDEEGQEQSVEMVFVDKDTFDATMSSGDESVTMTARRMKEEKKKDEKAKEHTHDEG